MPNPRYPRGSEWRKWDLHFHTPSSYDYQFKAATNAQIVDTMIGNGVGAFAITDHHVMDASRIREIQTLAVQRSTVFPGIELRTELGGSDHVHMIGIFPEDCDIDFIWTKLSAGLGITTAEVRRKGDDRIYVDFRESSKLIRECGGIVSVHAGRKANTIEGIRNSELYKQQQKTDLLTECVDILEVGQAKDVDDYRKIVFPAIGIRQPVCLFSDNHDIRSYVVSENCWIKADPTFRGLKQIKSEPEDRVFIGDEPPSVTRMSRRATRIAKQVEMHRIPGASTDETWFDCTIPLSNEMVAIIGKKGSGKSALSDVLGLLGNTPRFESFSFLRRDRFRNPKNPKARQFYASMEWADGTTDSVPNLDIDPSTDAVEKVRYIPQNYLEKICNEIGLGKGGQFYSDLQQVIFSHVSEVDRLGFSSLDQLLAYRSEETNRAIEQLVAEIRNLNREIVNVDERLIPQYRKSIEAQLAEKKRELDAHLRTKPDEVQRPDSDPKTKSQADAASEALKVSRKELQSLDSAIKDLNIKDAVVARRRSIAEKLLGKLDNIQRQVNAALGEASSDFDELGIASEQIVKLHIDRNVVEQRLAEYDTERRVTANRLDAEVPDSLAAKRIAVLTFIDELQTQLNAPQRAYQDYLQLLDAWEAARADVVGTSDAVGTIVHLEKQLADLDNLPAELMQLQKRRNRRLLEIYREKQKLGQYYRTYYRAVEDFLDHHPLAKSEQFRLTFNVSIADSGFASTFLGRLNRRKTGPFMGDEDGSVEMKRILDNTDFDSAIGTLRFVKMLFRKLAERDGKPLLLQDQLRNGILPEDIYDYVYSLGFLSPMYNLQWDGKTLEQLSPGERGNLLLVFYLLIDRDDIPLVIDQPEENLDNQTVYKTLVPCIKDAKKRRQIVLVTHNPNLAVVCDAEQVIRAEMQKDKSNLVTYTSGSIEDPVMNHHIVDVLEGTRPAFDKRNEKYFV